MYRKKTGFRKTLRFERLERRELLAGNVTATLRHGDLTVRGDAASNEVAVFKLQGDFQGFTTGDYVVLGGKGGNLGTTTVNNKAFEIFSAARLRRNAVDDLAVKMAGGDDVVGLGDIKALQTSATNLSAIADLVGALPTGMTPAATMTVRDDLKVRGGNGNDSVGSQGVNPRHGDLDTGDASGPETVSVFAGTVARELKIRTHQGADSVTLNNTQVGRSLDVSTGAGNDTLAMTSDTINRSLEVKLAAGNDTFNAQGGNNTVRRRTIVNGGDGSNIFNTAGTNQFNHLRKRHFPA